MKKQFSWIVLFIAISLISCIFGCKEPEIETDTKAPANVTSLTVTATDGNAVLTWKNPSDADFDGVQVSMSPAEGTLKNAVSLGKDVVSFDVSGLTIGKEYTFAVKTFDESLNYSEGTSVNAIYVDSSYAVGDIILTDGSKVSVNDVTTYIIDGNNHPIGVAAMISDVYGVPTPKVIGLQKSANGFAWVPENKTGYNTNFTNIVCTPSQTGSGTASTATFTGDTDGSDNWEEICAVDPTGTADAATNYPIFNFANTYGTTAGLTDSDYENGWYVPSAAELFEVYKNKEVIQTSLTKASGFTIGTSSYWSSSQSASYNDSAYKVDFDDGGVNTGNYSKAVYHYVFVLQALTAK